MQIELSFNTTPFRLMFFRKGKEQYPQSQLEDKGTCCNGFGDFSRHLLQSLTFRCSKIRLTTQFVLQFPNETMNEPSFHDTSDC